VDLQDVKDWIYDNRKGLVVGVVAGFVLSRILK
jgi:uncharacterized membrane-anchored protein YhcB (DUF1043 family)